MGTPLPSKNAAILLGTFIFLSSGSLWAQTRIVVCEVVNDRDGNIASRLTDELGSRTQYELVDYHWIAEELELAGVSMEDFLAEPDLLRSLAETAHFDVLMWGELDRARRARRLDLTLYEGASGLPLGSVSIELDRGRIDEEAFDWGIAEVESLILVAEPVTSPPLAEPESAEPVIASQEPRRPPRGAPPPAPPPGPEWLSLGIGMNTASRTMSLVGQGGGIDYESGFYMGLEGTIELWPVRLFSPGTLDGIGIRFRLARYFTDTLLVREESQEDLSIPTRHKELGIWLTYYHPIGPVEVGGQVGYASQAFILGANEVHESSQYNGFALGVGGRYHILEDLLDAGVEFEIRPGPRLGDPELIAYGGATSFGFGLNADVGVHFLKRFRAVGSYGFRQFRTTFDGNGTSNLSGSIESTDTYHQIALQLHLIY